MKRDNNLTRQVHDLIQGTDEWAAFRAAHHGASEAAAMLGLSKKVKRSELIRMKATGLGKEFTAWVQENILDHGHAVEALARPIVERIIGDDLYPVTCSLGAESASCDGLTLGDDIAFEHKQRNAELLSSVIAGVLPEEHAPQCQQVLMVTGAEKLIFVVSDGTEENMAYMWVYPDAAWFDRIIAGWEQFDLDVAAYVPQEVAEKPAAEVIMALPALVVQTRGEVVKSNLPAFQEAATAFIAKIKTDLATDEDFANAEATVKFCQKAEDDLEYTKSAVLGQAATIDDVMKTIDNIKEQLRSKRLALGKLVDKRKLEIKEAILAAVKLAYAEHVAALEIEIKPLRLPAAAPDFAGAMKNKRTLTSLQDAVDTLLANAKISTNATAADYRAKQTWCKESVAGFGHLFADMAQIITKPMEDFQLVVTTRVDAHKAAEAKKEADMRAKIAAQEQAKAEAAAAEKLAAERKADADRQAAEAKAVAERQAAADLVEHNRVAAATKAQLEQQAAQVAAQRAAEDATFAGRCSVVAVNSEANDRAAALAEQGRLTDLAADLAPAILLPVEIEVREAAPANPPSLRLGHINERIAPLAVSVEGLRALGFEPAATDKAAKLYHDADFTAMCAAMLRHIGAVQAKYAA